MRFAVTVLAAVDVGVVAAQAGRAEEIGVPMAAVGEIQPVHSAIGTGQQDRSSVTNVRSRTAEAFYWTAILISNTLGTALGDFLADSSGLGFAGGALLIGGLLV